MSLLVDRFGRPLSAPFGGARSGFMHRKTAAPAPLNGAVHAFANTLGTAAAVRWLRTFLGNTGQASTDEPWIVPFAMTLGRLYMKGTAGSADADKTQTYTLRKNDVDVITLPTIVTNTSPYELEDLVSTVAFAAGDRVAFTVLNSAVLTGTTPSSVMMLAEIVA